MKERGVKSLEQIRQDAERDRLRIANTAEAIRQRALVETAKQNGQG